MLHVRTGGPDVRFPDHEAAIKGTNFRPAALVASHMDHTRVYVGWDCHDPRALDVCLFSIQRHASDLVEIVSLKPKTVTALCGPDPDPGGEKQALARYLVPSLNDFDGWAVFVSSDVLFQADIYELWQHRDPQFAVMGVPVMAADEAAGALRTSLLMWNCGHPANRCLTPGAVAAQNPESLDRFGWLHRSMIGALPSAWCWREGVSDPEQMPKAIEFAPYKPWVGEVDLCQYADRWHDEAARIFGALTPTAGRTARA
jgi:hypothetical protein